MTVMINDMVVADEKAREIKERLSMSNQLWVATHLLSAIIISKQVALDRQVPLALKYANELIGAEAEEF